MGKIDTVIFDFGGVLIDWSPAYVYLKEFRGDEKKMHEFLNTICSWKWNENQDAGYPLERATEERVALYPEHERLIRMYYGRWKDMLGYEHTETVALLERIKNQGKHRLIGLTNWSHETFPVALERFPFLSWFEGIVVSGTEKMKKPDAEIYQLTLKRYNIQAENAVFIDDKEENITAALKEQIHGLHHTTARELEKNLIALGVL
ncbi:MAG: HAD family phosphatase [Flavobacteriaceae bacterium]|nr:HAD family phosphatase [Flavobacteriaceae bacterium]